MGVLRNLSIIVAMSAGVAQATNIWMSTSDIGSPLGEVPFIETETGQTDQKIHIWARPAPDQTLLHWSLDLRSTDFDVIAFKDFEVYNPILAEPEGVLPKSVVRYEHVNANQNSVVNPNLISDVKAFSTAHREQLGVGIGPASQLVDPFYDPVNDAWFLASASYNVIGPGRTDLYLQIGEAGIINQGEESSNVNVVFGDLNDPPLNGNWNRLADSVTPEATIVVQGSPVVPWREGAHITADDGRRRDLFGQSMHMSGDRIVVGVGQRNSAYIFERSASQWNQVAKVTPSDGGMGNFGASVAISGDRIVVGADQSDAAYIFEKNGASWSEVAVIAPSGGGNERRFGRSVGISGDHVVVGAPYDDDNGTQAGSAYIFERSDSSWTEVAELTARGSAPGDTFGESVAISGGHAIVGAGRNDRNGETSGAAYIFENSGSTWTEVDELIPTDLAAGDDFGASVATSGDRVIVGAQNNNSNGDNSGSAYIFEPSETGWTEVARLAANDASEDDHFGNSVAISEDHVVVGASSEGPSGSAYVFEESGSDWIEVAKLLGNDAMAYDRFGVSVATSEDGIVIGSPGHDHGTSGAVFVFVPREDVLARLVAGSPVSLGQTVDTPAESFDLTFDFRYLTNTGELNVLLDGISLGTIEAPTTLQDDFATVSLSVDDALLDRHAIDLEFVLDGPTGSALLINNIDFPSLINGDFQAGNLTGWHATVSANGFIEAVELMTIPEPSTVFHATLGLLALIGRRSAGRPKKSYRPCACA